MYRRTAIFVANDRRRVAREIMQRQLFHWSAAAAGAARLRPQHAKAGFGDPGGNDIEILRRAAARGKQNHQRPAAFSDHLDPHVIIGDDFRRALGPRGRGAEQKHAGGKGG